jgi:polyhydroxybutyrate depolymerase
MMLARSGLPTIAAFLAPLLLAYAWPGLKARAQDMDAEQRVVSVGGIQRYYLLHLPPGLAQPSAVVLVFHGGGGRPEGIMRRTGMNNLADQNQFIAVYPAGAERATGGKTWNIGGPLSASAADDVGFIRALLGDLKGRAPIDHARIYATGLSMGGVFTYRLACEMSDTFAAIAPVAATMVEPNCTPRSPVAILDIHGSDDERIPIEGGAGKLTASGRSWPPPQHGLSFWLHFNGCIGPESRAAEPGQTACFTFGQCRAPVEYCVVAGGGHDWPGEPRMERREFGASGQLFPASEVIWSFFAANPKHGR